MRAEYKSSTTFDEASFCGLDNVDDHEKQFLP